MYSLYIRKSSGEENQEIQLQNIWRINAKSDYAVSKESFNAEANFIALRTLGGKGILKLRSGETYTLETGSVGLFLHSRIAYYCSCEIGWNFDWFEFKSNTEIAVPRVITVNASSKEHSYINQCCYNLASKNECDNSLADALFRCLLQNWENSDSSKSSFSAKDQEIYHILEHGRNAKSSIAEMAAQSGMCERSFRSAVHSLTGFTPKEYIENKDMEIAMELLKTTDLTIADISNELYYSDPFYFSRVFKKHFGISPQKVRNLIL